MFFFMLTNKTFDFKRVAKNAMKRVIYEALPLIGRTTLCEKAKGKSSQR